MVNRTIMASCLASVVTSILVTLLLVRWFGTRVQATPPLVRAERFEVVDQRGEVKAYLGGPQYNDSLTILDSAGTERISLRVLAEGTAVLHMSDGAGVGRVGVYVNRQGGSALQFFDDNGNIRSVLSPGS